MTTTQSKRRQVLIIIALLAVCFVVGYGIGLLIGKLM